MPIDAGECILDISKKKKFCSASKSEVSVYGYVVRYILQMALKYTENCDRQPQAENVR